MNLSKIIKYIILFLIFLVLFLFYKFIYQTNSGANKTQQTPKNNVLKKYEKEIAEIKKLEKINKEKAKEKTNNLISKLPEQYKRYFSIGFNSNDNITFYGRVIDQYKKPVAGATVNYLIAGRYLSQGSGAGKVTSDHDGNFIIRGSGGGVTINHIVHPSIDFHHDPYDGERYEEGSHEARKASLHFSGHTNKIHGMLSYEHVSNEDPHIFKAWRISKAGSKYNKNIKRGRIFDGMYADGRMYTTNLSKRRLQLMEGIHEGHFQMSCKRKTLKNKMERRDKNDWVFTIVPIDGGIQEARKDYYLNQAPLDGYKKKLVVQYKASSKDYLHGIRNKRYYFTAHNNKTYGSILFSLIPFAKKDRCSLHMELYKYTTDGSRNLVSIPKYK